MQPDPFLKFGSLYFGVQFPQHSLLQISRNNPTGCPEHLCCRDGEKSRTASHVQDNHSLLKIRAQNFFRILQESSERIVKKSSLFHRTDALMFSVHGLMESRNVFLLQFDKADQQVAVVFSEPSQAVGKE
jgi:hypothetical protein